MSEIKIYKPNQLSYFMKNFGVYIGLIILLSISGILSPQSFNPVGLLNVAKQTAGLGIVAIGQTMVILTGGIDSFSWFNYNLYPCFFYRYHFR